jgi:hypothetical protein
MAYKLAYKIIVYIHLLNNKPQGYSICRRRSEERFDERFAWRKRTTVSPLWMRLVAKPITREMIFTLSIKQRRKMDATFKDPKRP